MNRRGFLGAIFGGLAAAATVDPERLLWTPGKRLISIPNPQGLRTGEYLFASTYSIGHGDLGLPLAEFERRYIQPALECVANQVDAECRKRMVRRPQFRAMTIPVGLERAQVGPMGRLSTAQSLVAFDLARGEFVGRVSCLVTM